MWKSDKSELQLGIWHLENDTSLLRGEVKDLQRILKDARAETHVIRQEFKALLKHLDLKTNVRPIQLARVEVVKNEWEGGFYGNE